MKRSESRFFAMFTPNDRFSVQFRDIHATPVSIIEFDHYYCSCDKDDFRTMEECAWEYYSHSIDREEILALNEGRPVFTNVSKPIRDGRCFIVELSASEEALVICEAIRSGLVWDCDKQGVDIVATKAWWLNWLSQRPSVLNQLFPVGCELQTRGLQALSATVRSVFIEEWKQVFSDQRIDHKVVEMYLERLRCMGGDYLHELRGIGRRAYVESWIRDIERISRLDDPLFQELEALPTEEEYKDIFVRAVARKFELVC